MKTPCTHDFCYFLLRSERLRKAVNLKDRQNMSPSQDQLVCVDEKGKTELTTCILMATITNLTSTNIKIILGMLDPSMRLRKAGKRITSGIGRRFPTLPRILILCS